MPNVSSMSARTSWALGLGPRAHFCFFFFFEACTCSPISCWVPLQPSSFPVLLGILHLVAILSLLPWHKLQLGTTLIFFPTLPHLLLVIPYKAITKTRLIMCCQNFSEEYLWSQESIVVNFTLAQCTSLSCDCWQLLPPSWSSSCLLCPVQHPDFCQFSLAPPRFLPHAIPLRLHSLHFPSLRPGIFLLCIVQNSSVFFIALIQP